MAMRQTLLWDRKGGAAGMEQTGFRGRYNKGENPGASVGGNASEKWLLFWLQKMDRELADHQDNISASHLAESFRVPLGLFYQYSHFQGIIRPELLILFPSVILP